MMISKGSSESEGWSNDAENSALPFAAFMSIRDLCVSKTLKTNY